MSSGAAAQKKPSRAWDALTPALAEWLIEALQSNGWERQTPTQAAVLPLFLGNKDVVVEVQSRHASWLTRLCC